MKTLHKTAISAVAAGLLSGLAYTPAFAADEPEASPITANVTVTNNYIYRGITQSNGKPAIQGGFDYAHESGFYIGNWNSSISWVSDSYNTSGGVRTSAPIEMDFYGGFKKEFIGEGFASDIGVLQYYYPTSGIQATTSYVNPNTTEIYAAQNFTFGPLTGFAKVSYAVTTLFGNANSTGSYYPDLTLNYDTGFWGITANGHVGYQFVAGNQQKTGSSFGPNAISVDGVSNNNLYTYTDWKLGLTKDFGGGLSGAIAYTGTNAKTYQGNYAWYSPQGKNNGRSAGLISLTKTF
ncbi:TorF family putative porin [Polynucleobacter sp. JS-JIR-5-A7]|uniref:TorF family putative porin n=1 Tax=Polynucleobacter sp. JS-JIR-5-A7 TaxID=1758395 RepID=UPI001BFE205D|nr:TorF family putative porin [Polynucleobacter sp. JS-JIR-5-A7]QWE06523.1 hypothetical protein AOC29_10550 [Polynucleobacter sp. JS-JIR-5-A7]